MTDRRAAIDIGTNSMRLLIVDDDGEIGRWQRVTGLGRGVDASGVLSADAIERTIAVLTEYGDLMRRHGVSSAAAVATSASRDAANAEDFLSKAEQALGVRPSVIDGETEARLSYRGATSDAPGGGSPLVIDIGGGSTEFVWASDEGVTGMSLDIGSVRLTDRVPVGRPATFEEIQSAAHVVESDLEALTLPRRDWLAIGVAGTWTSLAAVAADLPVYDRTIVHHHRLTRPDVDRLVLLFASLSVEDTARIPALDPGRAPVILAGSIIAREAMRWAGLTEIVVSERDLLDGLIATT